MIVVSVFADFSSSVVRATAAFSIDLSPYLTRWFKGTAATPNTNIDDHIRHKPAIPSMVAIVLTGLRSVCLISIWNFVEYLTSWH